MSNLNITEVCLMNIPLEKDYKHTFYFTSLEEQESYFESKVVRRFTDFSYQRKDNLIRIPYLDNSGTATSYDDLLREGINYVKYKNKAYSNKWFYAFITDITYINDDRTDLSIETDVMQTWAFNYLVRPSFVEREHVSNDTIGFHTYPEGLELGEYICGSHVEDDHYSGSQCAYILASTLNITKDAGAEKYSANGGGLYNGIYSGLRYYRFKEYQQLNEVLKGYENAGQSDCVNGIFLIPIMFAECDGDSEGKDNKDIIWSTTPFTYNVEVAKPKGWINSYSPINKKLFCYPYQYLLTSNNNGGSAIYRFEDFSNADKCTFKVQGALTPGGSIRLIPTNFKNIPENDEEGLNLGKFPTCNWQTDMYTNWLVQNSKSIALQNQQTMFNGVIGTASSIASMDIGGAISNVGNSYFAIKSTMVEKERQSLTPPQANGNTNCGDVVFSSGKNNFHFYSMGCKPEYLQKIDKYFSVFGYAINVVKTPNKLHRKSFWYTKTIDVNIDGNYMPPNDLEKIKQVYNNGITFWKNYNNIQNYGVDNSIELASGYVADLPRTTS